MKLVLFGPALIGMVTTISAISISTVFKEGFRKEWEAFKAEYGKVYSSSAEEEFRMKIFLDNMAYIANHNLLAHQGYYSFFLKMNQWGDIQIDEFSMNGVSMDDGNNKPPKSGATFIMPEGFESPTELDWRTKGAVTEVKNQQPFKCASCWSFSVTGSLEGQHYRKTGKLVSLSEQQLIDCDTANYGCGGGNMNLAFQYIQYNHGLDTEGSYPYHAKNETCKFKPSSVGATDKGFVAVPANEEALEMAVAAIGPISVAIDATGKSFLFYHHGIYNISGCTKENLNHGVLLVGYGPGYWLVKNSFGTMWGDEGYIKIAKGRNNCGIDSWASYPLV